MRSIFPGYYKVENLQSLWAEATFVLDTNVLLSLYRYPQKAREETLATLEKIKDRLWIPYQVALEFQRKRLSVIQSQNSDFDDVEDSIKKIEVLITKLDGLKKRHSLIDPTEFIKLTGEAISSFRHELAECKQAQVQVNHEDIIRSEIDNLLDGRLGKEPSSEAIAQWQDEGKKRYASKIPPGYMDQGKDKAKDQSIYHDRGIEYNSMYGDLIIWKQTIAHCKEAEIKKIIFVTQDSKEDWWENVGGKTIGSRPELVDEISRLGGVTHFHLYNSESFLNGANKYLDAQIPAETIGQVRDISSAANKLVPRQPALFYDRPLINAARNWLASRSGGEDKLVSFGSGSSYAIFRDGVNFNAEIVDIRRLASEDAKNLVLDKVNYDASVKSPDTWRTSYVFIIGEEIGEFFELKLDVDSLLEILRAPVVVYYCVFAAHSQNEFVHCFTSTNLRER